MRKTKTETKTHFFLFFFFCKTFLSFSFFSLLMASEILSAFDRIYSGPLAAEVNFYFFLVHQFLSILTLQGKGIYIYTDMHILQENISTTILIEK